MSTYLEMWKKAKELTPRQRKDLVVTIDPPRGIFVNFRGVRVIDIDLMEALDHLRRHHNRKARVDVDAKGNEIINE